MNTAPTAGSLVSADFTSRIGRDNTPGTTTADKVVGFQYMLSRHWNNKRTYNITNSYGVYTMINEGSSWGTAVNITNHYHQFIEDPGTLTKINITNLAGIWIEKVTAGTNNYGIVLDGDGIGADVVLGANRETALYGNAGDFIIDTAGNVGIGTDSPNYKLQIGEAGDGTEARANAWNTLSDGSLKTNLVKINNAVGKISRINGYYFNWKNGSDTRRHVGLIAQEVQKVLPEIVSEDSKGVKSLDYSKITSLLIEAVKEQQKTITELTGKVNKLEQEVKLKGTTAHADIELN
ncbi:MAG TPA: tail fiber domain-containing protein [Nitrospirae bacterium]|nr:tail fiber domain-containing protein [Nitrospirota bacterium]